MTEYAKGMLVEIKMPNHTYVGQIGTIDVVLKNQTGIPSAILVKMTDGFSDWFFGITKNLIVCSIDWKQEGF